MSMAGKTVMITGASRGIGAAAAREFAGVGANVVLLSRGTNETSEIAAEIGSAARAIASDVSDYDSMSRAVDETVAAFGGVDVLVGNAGVVEPISHIATADPAGWGQVIDINLKGVFHGMRAVLPMMLDAGGGTIITTSSGAAYGPVEAWSAYCSSKAGAKMLTASLNKEYGDKGIRALGLSPGTVATQMQREIKASGINPVSQLDWSDHIPPEWPAKALVWMCSAEADPWLGNDISLRDEDIRRKVGLI